MCKMNVHTPVGKSDLLKEIARITLQWAWNWIKENLKSRIAMVIIIITSHSSIKKEERKKNSVILSSSFVGRIAWNRNGLQTDMDKSIEVYKLQKFKWLYRVDGRLMISQLLFTCIELNASDHLHSLCCFFHFFFAFLFLIATISIFDYPANWKREVMELNNWR